jgi:hypothetical protein
MTGYADNGFGELVEIANPYGHTTRVYVRHEGALAMFVVEAKDHVVASTTVCEHLGYETVMRFGRYRRPSPVLAVIDGGKQ